MVAVNQVKEFRYRIEHNEVFEYEQISGSITVRRQNETFGFAYFDYYPNFDTFRTETKSVIDSEKTANGLHLKPEIYNLIHYSVLPEINFSSMQHAQMITATDSVPKITFGKLKCVDGQLLLPISVHVHHALCDGLHVSKFLAIYNRHMQIT